MRNKKDVEFSLHCSDPSLCKVEFAKDADLNYVVRRFLSSGQLPQASERQPLEGDFSNSPSDFADLMNTTVRARQRWEQLELEFRNQFNNDFETYLDALEAAQNQQLAEKPAEKPAEPKAEDTST